MKIHPTNMATYTNQQKQLPSTSTSTNANTPSDSLEKVHCNDDQEKLALHVKKIEDDIMVATDHECSDITKSSCSSKAAPFPDQNKDEVAAAKDGAAAVGVADQESGRDRLKRHRMEMAGRVWIPDIWGQEDFLKDWIDCNAFDASLVNNSIISARAALVQECQATTTTNSTLLKRIENSDER